MLNFKGKGIISVFFFFGRVFGNNAQSLSFRQNQESGVPNITGRLGFGSACNLASGAFYQSSGESRTSNTSGTNISVGNFDAIRVSNKYKNNLDEVVTDNIAVRYYYKAF